MIMLYSEQDSADYSADSNVDLAKVCVWAWAFRNVELSPPRDIKWTTSANMVFRNGF